MNNQETTMDDETKKQLHEDRLMRELGELITRGPSRVGEHITKEAADALLARGLVCANDDGTYGAMLPKCVGPLAQHMRNLRAVIKGNDDRIHEIWNGIIEAKERHIVATDLMAYAVEQLCKAAGVDFGLCDDYSLPEKVLVIARRITADSLAKDDE